MAKVSALSLLTAATTTDSDVFYIADTSAAQGKKITVGELKKLFGAGGVAVQSLVSSPNIHADGANYDVFVLNLNHATATLTIDSPVANKFYLLRLTHTMAGSVLTLPGVGEKNPDGSAIAQSSGAGDYDEFALCFNGSGFTWTFSKFGAGGVVTPPGGGSGTPELLQFGTDQGLVNVGNAWSGTRTNNLYNNWGKETTKLLKDNDNGYIQFLWPGQAGTQCIVGFRINNVNGPYSEAPGYQYAAFVNDNNGVYYIDNGNINSVAFSIADGTWVRVERANGTVTLKTSVDKTTWTVRHTYSQPYSLSLVPVLNINNTQSLPQIEGFNFRT